MSWYYITVPPALVRDYHTRNRTKYDGLCHPVESFVVAMDVPRSIYEPCALALLGPLWREQVGFNVNGLGSDDVSAFLNCTHSDLPHHVDVPSHLGWGKAIIAVQIDGPPALVSFAWDSVNELGEQATDETFEFEMKTGDAYAMHGDTVARVHATHGVSRIKERRHLAVVQIRTPAQCKANPLDCGCRKVLLLRYNSEWTVDALEPKNGGSSWT